MSSDEGNETDRSTPISSTVMHDAAAGQRARNSKTEQHNIGHFHNEVVAEQAWELVATRMPVGCSDGRMGDLLIGYKACICESSAHGRREHAMLANDCERQVDAY